MNLRKKHFNVLYLVTKYFVTFSTFMSFRGIIFHFP